MKLNLFFTDGVSLQTWDSVGMFEREVAIYRKLQQRGVEIGFVTYGNSNEQKYVGRLPNVNLRFNRFNLPVSMYKFALRNFPPGGQVFKSNQLVGAETASKAAKKAEAKFVARGGYLPSLMHEARYGKTSKEIEQARQQESDVFSVADRVVMTTQFAADHVVEQYGVPPHSVHVIPNYVETDRFNPGGRKTNPRFRIGTVGRLDYQKNLSALIEAVGSLDLELVIVGNGPYIYELKKQSADSKAKIVFMGNVSNNQLPELLNSLDAFVLPSFYEGHPKALLEAMSCGLPVIGTRVQGIREVVQDNETGLLCETDPASIRDAVLRLQQSAELRHKLGAAGRKYVEENFALDHIVDMEFALLSELVTE